MKGYHRYQVGLIDLAAMLACPDDRVNLHPDRIDPWEVSYRLPDYSLRSYKTSTFS